MKRLIRIMLVVFIANVATGQEFDWVKGAHGEMFSDLGFALATDAEGNVYTTGSFDGLVDFDPGVGVFNLDAGVNWNTFILKHNANGDFLWAKQLFGGQNEGTGIAIDEEGDLYICGDFNETVDFDPSIANYNLTSNGGNDMYILKLNSDGEFIWAKHAGGDEYDWGTYVDVDNLGNVVVTGRFRLTVDFNPDEADEFFISSNGDLDIFILKLNSEGDFIWVKNIGAEERDLSGSVLVTEDRSIISTGQFSGTVDFDPNAGVFNLTSTGTYNCFVSKLDENGDFVWAKVIEATGHSTGVEIQNDPAGNLYLTGTYQGIADFDPGVGLFNQSNESGSDIFVLKLNEAGELDWVYTVQGAGIDWGTSIFVDDMEEVYVTGRYFETIDFDAGIEEFNLTSAGDADLFVSKLDYNGRLLWVKSFGGEWDDYGYSIRLDLENNILVTGAFSGSVNFNPEGAGAVLNSSGGFDIFTLKLNQLTLGVEQESQEFQPKLTVFPNPANQKFTIQSNALDLNSQVVIYDSQGKSIAFKTRETLNGIEIELNEKQNGLFFIQVNDRQGTSISKIIVE